APEGRGDAAVVGIAHDLAELSAADQATVLAAELELVAGVVDAPRTAGPHEDAPLDRTDQVLERGITRLDVEVAHPVDRCPVPPARAGGGDRLDGEARPGRRGARRGEG